MEYEIILITGDAFFDHPLCGTAMIKKWLEKNGFLVGVIEKPQNDNDVKKLGRPKLFFGVSSGSIDSMLRKYTPMKKLRDSTIPDRADIVYSNWIRKNFGDSIIVLGGTEATLRRFTHYDYWQNGLRKSILLDSKAEILVYGNGEKQVVEIAKRIKGNKPLVAIDGTCVISKELPKGFIELPSHEEVSESKEKFCDMQLMFTNRKNIAQKTGDRYVLQYKSPEYNSSDLDEYYELPFTRNVPRELRGFEFSVVTHRGCIGNCNFCTLKLTQGDKIISRSEESILREIKGITKLEHFKGNIDDLGGPSANMYGMDCSKCENSCIDCTQLDRANKKLLELLRQARQIGGVENVFVRSGIRYDLAADEYLCEIAKHHVYDTLRIAPEHVSADVLKLMNKNKGDLKKFLERFEKIKGSKELSFYFLVGHPGSTLAHSKELAEFVKHLKNAESVQVFTPTPMSLSTCMYYTGLNPFTKEKIYVPYTYNERKEQKRVVMNSPKKG